jgi:hypothetical protein
MRWKSFSQSFTHTQTHACNTISETLIQCTVNEEAASQLLLKGKTAVLLTRRSSPQSHIFLHPHTLTHMSNERHLSDERKIINHILSLPEIHTRPHTVEEGRAKE